MIKVLNKSFAILEEIVLASPNPVQLGVLAEKLDLNKATCSRIIGDLVAAGYIVQVSRMAGYVAGPRAHAFKMHTSYKDDLMREAEPIVRECAEKVGQSILLVELHHLQRYILCHHNYNPRMNIRITQMAYSDTLNTATGLMLISHMSTADVEKLFKLEGIRSGGILEHEGIASPSQLMKLLKKIKKEHEYVYEGQRDNNLSIAAYPVYKNSKVIASIGLSAPKVEFAGKDRDDMLSEVKTAAARISAAISHIGSIG